MTKKQSILWNMLVLFVILHLLLSMIYIFIIHVFNALFSIVSISAILIPSLFLLLFEYIVWKQFIDSSLAEMKVHKNFKKVTIICLIPVLVCLFMLGLNEYNSNFTSSKWSEKPSKRVEIIDDLLLNYDFKGMTKNEVINILGTPSETEYFKKDNNIVYHLGYERGLISIDSEWLVINFDGNEIVINYDVVTD